MVRNKPLSGDKISTADVAGLTASVEKHSSTRPCLVVGIGASGGGQEALEQLFSTLPADCGLAYVVIMHLHPDGPSYLPEILGRCTPMPVLTAQEGMSLQPNTVHVIAPGTNLTVFEGRVRIESADRMRGTHHPIDQFFQSLAVDAAESGIAVILSGFGIDGTNGVKAVREAGGIVLAQDPASAVNSAMPRSAIATGAVNFVLPVDEIAHRIAEIARGSCVLSQRSCRVHSLDDELSAIFRMVKLKTGHDFSSYKTNTVMRRIERRMAMNEVSGIGKYIALIEENPLEAQALCQDILIGVTSFFRDQEAFEVLRQEIIPRLFEGRNPEEPVRIWHACCATGEEVYSMAILIQEYLHEHGQSAKVQLFATDIDETAIAQARAGLYHDDIEHDLEQGRLNRFFTRTDGRWQVKKQIREMVVFAHHSLIKDPPFSRLDLLVCRNFLIYLNQDMQKRLITLFHQVLKTGGILFLGSSETVGRNSELFSTIHNKWKIFERLESKRRMETIFPLSTSVRMPMVHRPERPAEASEPSPGMVAERLLMERYSPPCVVVSDKLEVVHVSTRLSRFLEVPTGEPTRDILRMAREDLRPTLRAAIYKAFAEQKRIEFRGVKVVVEGCDASLNLIVEPLGPIPGSRMAMVVFEPGAPPATLTNIAGGESTPGGETSKEMLIHQLEEQLRITHEQLQATSEQLETSNEGFMSANEELMSINEEFQSANEELQSTNEELETSKEELQALNEELITVNAELQGKVEELNQANSDRENLLASSGIATIFLDRELHIKGFTPAVADIFNLIPTDIGRPFQHLAGKIDWTTLSRDAETVLAGQLFAEEEITTLEKGHCYLKRITPYRTQDGRVDGIVLTFIDITERKRMEEQTAHLASFPQLNPNPVLEVDSSGNVTFFNPATQRILERLGMQGADAALFLPVDLDGILESWDRKGEATLHREIIVNERVFGETIFLTPQFDAARIYAFDITDRKRAQEALAESEERVRHKLDSILSPDGDIGNLDLGDIIDARSLQALVDDYYDLTGMPMGLIDLKGNVLVGVGWQDVCTKFHRVNPETCRNCVESDVLLSAGVPHGEYKIYKCKNHMWDVATPVMVGDRHFGNLFMGQFFFEDEPLDYELFRSQARQYGFDEQGYIAALEAVPRLNRKTLNTSMSFFMKLADILSKLSYSNLKLARSLTERDTLMDSLREREEQLRLFIRHAPAALAMFDSDMRYLSVSRRWLSDYGLGERNLIGESHYDVFPEITAEWREAHRRALAGEVVRSEGDRFERADGSVQWIRWEIRPWKDAAGKIGGIVISADDISDIKNAEEILRRYELLAGNSRDIILFLRREDGHILEANTAAVNAYGYDHKTLLGFTVNELRAPESLALTAAQMAEADSHGILFETVHRRSDGSTFPVEVSSQGANIASKRTLISIIRDITERKRAEDALRENRERLELALASSRMATFDWDIVKDKRTWSDGVHSLLGTNPETFTGTAEEFFRIIHPDDRSSVQANLARAVETIGVYETEYRAVWPDGSVHHISARGKVHSDDAGQAVLMAGVCWDISERKLTEERLWVLARTLKALNNSSQALLHTTDELSLLQAVCRIVIEDCGQAMVWIGFAEDDKEKSVHPVASAGFEEGYLETLGISWADTEKGRGPTGTAIRTGKPCRCSDMLTDPAFEPWRDEARKRGYASSLVLPLMGDGKAFGAISIYSTKPHAFAEEETDLLMQLADELAYGIRTLRLRVAHEQAEEMLNAYYRRQNLLADTAGRLLAADSPQQIVDSLCQKVMEFLDCNAFFNFLVDEKEGRLHLNACAGIPDEERQKIEWLDYGVAVCGCAARDACRIVAEDIPATHDPRTELVKSYGIKAYACHPLMVQGRVLGTLSFGTRNRTSFNYDDLSLMKAVTDQVAIAMERKRAEESLRLAKEAAETANQAKSQFLANMSHELRTPMTGVLGMLDLAIAGHLEDQQREFIDTARKSAASLLRILNDILDLTKLEVGKLTMEENPFSLSECLAGTVDILIPEARRKGLNLTLSITDNVPATVVGDQLRLQQVLTNLIANAVKFTDLGKVEVRVDAGCITTDGKREITFSIVDTGIGIPEDKKNILFKPFSQVDSSDTRRYGGTGLGLAISREIVERMGGTITFENHTDLGSNFSFTVPLGEVATVCESTHTAETTVPLESAPQLCDDGRKPRLLLAEDDATIRRLLETMLRLSNFETENAENGQKAVDMWKHGDYDLILMDVQMPVMDGFSATRAIREMEESRGGHTLIVAMTAHALKKDEARCLEAGMDAYISKPVDMKASIALIKDLISQRDQA